MSNPDTLIERDGFVYKLMESKEERVARLKREAEEEARNLGAFKLMVGVEQYEKLHNDKVVLTYSTGGNYSSTYHFDFGNEVTWVSDEYSAREKEGFGKSNYFRKDYNGKLVVDDYVSAPIHKAIQDYWYEKLTAKEEL